MKGLAQIDVVAPRPGIHRPEFGIGQGAGQGEQGPGHPSRHDPARCREKLGDLARGKEDARPDD